VKKLYCGCEKDWKMATLTNEQNNRYATPYRRDLRFGPVLGKKQWQVGQLWDLHHEVIRMLLLGMKQTDIASKLGITDCQVSKIKNSQIVQDRLSLMRAARDVQTVDISRDILEVAPRALKLLKNIVENEGEGRQATIGLRSKVAESLLDRAGFGAVKKVQSENAHTFYDAAEIERIKQRAMIADGVEEAIVVNG
jgi:transcriptional regulator with XRE-family HTH domain